MCSCSSLWPQVLRTRRASQAILARVEECLPSLPTYTLDRHLARLKAFGDFEHEILMTHRVSPNLAAGDGTTLLHLACGVGLSDLALRVLERSADVALEHRYFGAPLMLAAERGAGSEVLGVWEGFQRRREEVLMTCRELIGYLAEVQCLAAWKS